MCSSRAGAHEARRVRTSVRNVEYTDGYDAYVERVKMRHGKIISGNSMIGDERRGLDYGFDHVPS